MQGPDKAGAPGTGDREPLLISGNGNRVGYRKAYTAASPVRDMVMVYGSASRTILP
jgi:hypothetical protein